MVNLFMDVLLWMILSEILIKNGVILMKKTQEIKNKLKKTGIIVLMKKIMIVYVSFQRMFLNLKFPE